MIYGCQLLVCLTNMYVYETHLWSPVPIFLIRIQWNRAKCSTIKQFYVFKIWWYPKNINVLHIIKEVTYYRSLLCKSHWIMWTHDRGMWPQYGRPITCGHIIYLRFRVCRKGAHCNIFNKSVSKPFIMSSSFMYVFKEQNPKTFISLHFLQKWCSLSEVKYRTFFFRKRLILDT